MALPFPTFEFSPLVATHALAWVTALARAFVLPVLGCALLVSVTARLPPGLRRVAPTLVRIALGLLVLAAYGPLASELTRWSPGESPLYRAASLVVLVCALALVVVLPLLAEGLSGPGPRQGTREPVLPLQLPPPPAPRRGTTFTAVGARADDREPPDRLAERLPAGPCPPYPGRPAARVTGHLTMLPLVTAEVLELAPVLRLQPPPSSLARTLDEDAPRATLTPPRIRPVRPDETVRVATPLAPPVEVLSPTHPMAPSQQARLLAASALPPPPTPRQARPTRSTPGVHRALIDSFRD
jgi:hypothetical protein